MRLHRLPVEPQAEARQVLGQLDDPVDAELWGSDLIGALASSAAGLSSLIVTMIALGMLMSFAKREPGAAQALADAGPGVPRRILSWLGLAGRSG